MLMNERYGVKARTRFLFYRCVLGNYEIKEITLSDDFFKRYYGYLEINQFPFRVEDAVCFYLIEQGYKIDRRYLGRNSLDISAIKDGIETFIECKSETDSIKFEQFKVILEFKAEIWYVLPLHYSSKDTRDLRDAMSRFKI